MFPISRSPIDILKTDSVIGIGLGSNQTPSMSEIILEIVPAVTLPPGASLTLDAITPAQEADLVAFLDTQPWNTSLSRRTQHYGYEYNYKSRNAATPATPIPSQLQTNAPWATQAIINEYTQKQGITAHTDAKSFGPRIQSLTLDAEAVMVFTRGSETIRVLLPRRSLLTMDGDARTLWKHEIPSTVNMVLPDGTRVRKPDDYRRISVTYRTMA